MSEWGDPPAKRARTQIKAVIRERGESKAKAAKAGKKKAAAKPRTARPKKQAAASMVPEPERRRSGRSHKASNYKERDDRDDEEEMLDGVAEWTYEDEGGSSDETDRDPDAGEGSEDEEEAADGTDESADEAPASSRRNGQKTRARPAAVRASALAQLDKGKRPAAGRARGRRAARGSSDMDEDDDDGGGGE